MVNIKLTIDQLDTLTEVLEYVANCEYDHYVEFLEENDGQSDKVHIYQKVVELQNLKWSNI